MKSWGRAHVDYTQQGMRYQNQVVKWKRTKKELYHFIAIAYNDTRNLKEHLVANDVSQDHLYSVHEQIKCTAKHLRKSSLSVQDLMKVAENQMTVNVEAIKDFGTLLRAIPHDSLEIQDFYRSIRSFFIGLLWRFEKKFGVNNMQVIGILHAFEHFLLACDLLEPLPEGKTIFMTNMASIIRDHYSMEVDVANLTKWTREQMKKSSSASVVKVEEVDTVVDETDVDGFRGVDDNLAEGPVSPASSKLTATKRPHESEVSEMSDDDEDDIKIAKIVKKWKGNLKDKGSLKRFSQSLIRELNIEDKMLHPGRLHFKGDPEPKAKKH